MMISPRSIMPLPGHLISLFKSLYPIELTFSRYSPENLPFKRKAPSSPVITPATIFLPDSSITAA